MMGHANGDGADDLNLDRLGDTLLSTQAAQLADYLRARQQELERRQQELEQQRQAMEALRGVPPGASLPNSPPSPTAESPEPDAHPGALLDEPTERLLREVRRIHRETLELRIVTEQLWSQLAGRAPREELTRSLSALRRQLDDHYRQERDELADQQQRARQLLERLDEQQQHVRRQRRDLQAWVDARYEEFEVLSAQLLAREQELQRRQRQYDVDREQAEQDIRQYQRQIRQLTAQLRCREELDRAA